MTQVAVDNEEALEAWNGVLFDRFVQYRHLVVEGIAPHGNEAIRRHPPRPGDRVLDIGCGFGDTTLQLALLAGATGTALGVDVAPRFIDAARDEARRAGASQVRFEVKDVQASGFDETFDCAFSRCGTMFFANPAVALRNVRQSLVPGGRLCMVTWRRKLDNDWMSRAENLIKPLVEVPEETDEPRCGPGPFSMADADTTSGILLSAGFENITFERCDLSFLIGRDLDEAVDFNLALGPAAEVVRLAGAGAAEIRPQLEALLRDGLAEFDSGEGVRAASSTWIVTATA